MKRLPAIMTVVPHWTHLSRDSLNEAESVLAGYTWQVCETNSADPHGYHGKILAESSVAYPTRDAARRAYRRWKARIVGAGE